MRKSTVFNVIVVIVSIFSLGVASYSLKLSFDAEKRQNEIHASALTSVLLATYDKERDSLALRTSEESKLLQFGGFVFPSVFSLEPIGFKLPSNKIDLRPIKSALTKVLRDEAYILYKKDPRFFKDIHVVSDIPIPIYAEYQSTFGGDSVINKSSYYMVFRCSFNEAFILDESIYQKALEGNDLCTYQTLLHQGRIILEGFYLFHWPWESEEEIAGKVAMDRREQILANLKSEWEQVRLSKR